MTVRRLTLVLFLFAGVMSACGPGATRGVNVERTVVELTVRPDGSMDVVEDVTARATTPADGRFTRVVSGERADGMTDIQATLDGRPVTADTGSTSVTRAHTLRATWVVPQGDPHVLHLHYRVMGALAIVGSRALLDWDLPPTVNLPIDPTRVNVAFPAGSVVVAGPAIGFSTASAEMMLNSLSMFEPDWQRDARNAELLMPAFIAAGLCLVAVAAGVLVMIRVRSARPAGVSAGGDADRRDVVRGLRVSGVAGLALAVTAAAGLNWFLGRRYGVWPLCVPAGVGVSSVMFLLAAWRLASPTPTAAPASPKPKA